MNGIRLWVMTICPIELNDQREPIPKKQCRREFPRNNTEGNSQGTRQKGPSEAAMSLWVCSYPNECSNLNQGSLDMWNYIRQEKFLMAEP